MKLRWFTRTRNNRRRSEVDEVLAAYSAWRHESAGVRAAYGRWARSAKQDAWFAFAAYRVALDREERAAAVYAQLLPRAERRPEFHVARQLAELPAPFGAMYERA
ncbi:MAG TPA: hypothetical protein VMA77_25220 [Solirubrobacteraceae bacterium]|nr:hypothetical protein [Solirubrobacteraceae bacterium]